MACALVARVARAQPRQSPASRRRCPFLAGGAGLQRPREPAKRDSGRSGDRSAPRRTRRCSRRVSAWGSSTPPSGSTPPAFRDHLGHEQLEEALELCRGEPLAGLDDEWVHEYRDAHRDLLSELLERIAAKAEASAAVGAAIAYTRQSCGARSSRRGCPAGADCPAGRRGRPSRCTCRVRTASRSAPARSRHLPSEQTRELVAQIRDDAAAGEATRSVGPRAAQSASAARRGSWTPGQPFPLPPGLGRRAPAAFVGRSREMAAPATALVAGRAGGGARVALLAGEAGIGKSRLATGARPRGTGKGSGGAARLGRRGPAGALSALRRGAQALPRRRRPGRARPPSAGPARSELEPITPGLQRQGGEQRPGRERAETRRYRLFDAVASLLAELSADAPVLLVLDDLHWADHSSVALLLHALESRPEMRLLVVATQRQTETAPGGPLTQALHHLTTARTAHARTASRARRCRCRGAVPQPDRS